LFTVIALEFSTLKGNFYWGLPYPSYVDFLFYVEVFGVGLMMLSVTLSVAIVGYEQTHMSLFFKNHSFSYMWIAGFFLVFVTDAILRYTDSRLTKQLEKAIPKVPEEEVKEAKSITLDRVGIKLKLDPAYIELVKKKLIQQKKVLISGQITPVKFFWGAGNTRPFRVVETDPSGYVKVTEKTIVKILEKPPT